MRHKYHLWGIRISIISTLLISLTSQARDLSLKQALELAVEHSHRLKKANAERTAYSSALQSANAARLPRLSIDAFAFYKDETPPLDIALPSSQSLAYEIGTKDNYQTDLRLSVPLFTGGRISSRIQAAKASRVLYGALKDASLNELLYQTRVAYLALYKANRLLDAAQASLDRAMIIRTDVRTLFAAGTADSIALLEAELASNEAYFKVKEAESTRRSAKISLTALLNLPGKDTLVISDKLPIPGTIGVSPAPPVRPELHAAEASVTHGKAQVSLAQSAYFPTISAYGGYSYGKPNLDLFNKTWMDYYSVGTKLTWSFNVGRETKHTKQWAQYLLRAARQERDELSEQFERDAELAFENVTLDYHRYELARSKRQISRANYRLAHQQHRQGALSSNRLLEIGATLSQAEAALAAALVDYHLALSAYYFAIGSEQLKEGF